MHRGLQLCLAALTAAAASISAEAQEFWHSENIQVLRGESYELGPRERTIITVEHANRWSGGDFFLFTDFAFNDDGSISAYGEITPRFSFENLFDIDFGDGLVRDVFFTVNYERGEQGLERYLGGISADLDLPGFVFFKVMALHRDDPERPGSTEQLTLAWNRPVTIGDTHLLFEGFSDIAGGEGASVANTLIVPRVLVNLGSLTGEPGNFWAGVEWQYWDNKFGVDGVTESVVQLQLKWVLDWG